MHTGGLPTPPPPCPNRQLQTAVPQLPARNRNVTLPAKRDRLRPGSRQLPIGNQRFTDFDKRSCRPGTPSINRMQVNGRVLTRRKLTGSGVTGCRDGATWQLQGCQAVRLSGRWLSGRWLSGCQAVGSLAVGSLAVRLSGCQAVRLSGCQAVRLLAVRCSRVCGADRARPAWLSPCPQ